MTPEQKKNLPLDVHWLSGFLSVSGAHQHPTAASRRQKTLQHVFPVALSPSLSCLLATHSQQQSFT